MNRYRKLVGSKKISEDFETINTNFELVEQDIDSHTATLTNHQAQISAEQQARINADNAHQQSAAAHSAAAITLAVAGLIAGNVNAGIAELLNFYQNIIAGPAPSAEEIIDGRVGADGVVMGSLGAMIRKVHAQQLAGDVQTANLKHGDNLINASQAGPVAVTATGNTQVNLLGKDGNCEDVSKWLQNSTGGPASAGGFAILDSSNKIYGSNAIKLTLSSVQDGMGQDIGSKMQSGKYYLLATDFKLGTAYSVFVRFYNGSTIYPAPASTSGYSYLKISPSQVGASVNAIGVFVNGVSGLYAYVDGIRLYEISAAEYAKIDVDPEYTGEKLADKFPYVDGLQHVTCPVISKVGKNMLPPFSEWTLHANAVVTEPYKLTLNATGDAQMSECVISVLPNMIYTAKFANPTADTALGVTYFDSSGNALGGQGNPTSGWNTNVNPSGVFTTPATCAFVVVRVYNIGATGPLTFINPQLELGSVATSHEQRNDNHLYAFEDSEGKPLKLAGDPTTEVYDILTVIGNKGIKTKCWMTDVVLDGSLAWTFSTSRIGYKEVALLSFPTNRVADTGSLVKFDGKPLTRNPSSSSDTGSDQYFIHANGDFYVEIADADATGFDLTTPTGIKAYFAAKPYKLSYQLATPQTETVQVEGSLSLHTGGNVLSVGEGVIVREKVTPYLYDGNYYINGGDSSAFTDKRLERFINVYRDGGLDIGWELNRTDPSNGKYHARIPTADYDPAADYYVTYIALDKYAMTAALNDVKVEYQSSAKSVQNELVKHMADAETSISINTNQIINILIRLKAASIA